MIIFTIIMKNNVKNRSKRILNLKQYNKKNKPENTGFIDIPVPKERHYVLRMLIKTAFSDFKIPESLEWCRPIIEKAYNRQKELNIHQPYCYLTIRSGLVNSQTDDEWHVDGFSLNVTHIPEQNYIWTDKKPTEYIVKKFKFPKDFNHKKHNIHQFFQDRIKDTKIHTCKEKNLYCMDPYIVHKRPDETNNINRCFIRVSFTPIEIDDINNTINPLLKTHYTRDSVKSFRNKLERYGN